MKIVLASGSPRRKELLERLFTGELQILPAEGEEVPPVGAGPDEIVKVLSEAKAREVARKCGREDLVIAADTIVWLGGKLLGKPADEAEAARMLHALSGQDHEVYTGVTLIHGDTVLSEAEMTKVSFRNMTDREIEAYIRSGEPMDKAGAYGIQGLGSVFVRKIEGDFFNVMGLPVCRLGEMLKTQGVELL